MTTPNIIDIDAVRRSLAASGRLAELSRPRERSCLCCSKPFVSTGPGNRVCPDCRMTGDAADAVEGRSA